MTLDNASCSVPASAVAEPVKPIARRPNSPFAARPASSAADGSQDVALPQEKHVAARRQLDSG
jgi:hypothetical protein